MLVFLISLFLTACVAFLFGRTFGIRHAYYTEKEKASKNRATVYRPQGRSKRREV